jgi:hypothetical protein
MALSVEHPVEIVNGTKDPLRSVFFLHQQQDQPLMEFRVDCLGTFKFLPRLWVRTILEPLAS